MPKVNGMEFLVVARDDLSGWVEARALGKNNSLNVAKFIWEDIICWHGCPERIIIDRGPENKGLTEELLHCYQIRRVQVSAYYAQANGLVEQGHKTVIDALAKMSNKVNSNWVKNLSAVLWADCTTIRSSTGLTPYQLLYGNEAVLPIDVNVLT